MLLIALDPSGNSSAREGDGTTGIAWFIDGELLRVSSIPSSDFDSTEAYWTMIGSIIKTADTVVCESYRLFASKAKQQIGSSLETPQLIGYLRMVCWEQSVPFILQDPAIKIRFADDVLVETEVVERRGERYYIDGVLTNIHGRDAVRHGLYYLKYGVKK